MTDLYPVDDVMGDDALLDQLGSRSTARGEPVAVLLGALAAHADAPLPLRTGRSRRSRHRYLGAFAAVAIAASGAGVAAAVSMPDRGPSAANRARILQEMKDAARSDAPSGLLSRLGLPTASSPLLDEGLVLVRRPDGAIVLLPPAQASLVVAAERQAAGHRDAPGDGQDTAQGGDAQGGSTAGSPSEGDAAGAGAQGEQATGADASAKGNGHRGQDVPPAGPTPPGRPAPTSTEAILTTGGAKLAPTPTPTPTEDASDTATGTPTENSDG